MTRETSSTQSIPATREVLAEAESLAADILRDIELSQHPLSVIVLKALRLARLLNDFQYQQIFEWESGGYPRNPESVSKDVWQAATHAGRPYFSKDPKSGLSKRVMYTDSIEEIEHTLAMGTTSLEAAQSGRRYERQGIRIEMSRASGRLASRRTLIYSYASRVHYELRLSGLADSVFGRLRSSVDSSIGMIVPESARKLSAVYENLKSDNPEDWANATHSCRRVLQDLADALFPARSEPIIRDINGKSKQIGLGPDQYINRLVCYIESRSDSNRFTEIVGSHLRYIGDRLDSLFGASQKGSHSTVTQVEADRCVVYTYLLVGDILSLAPPKPPAAQDHVRRESEGAPKGDVGVATADSE